MAAQFTLLLCLALGFACSGQQKQHGQSKQQHVASLQSAAGLPVVEIVLNGDEPHYLLLDTGAWRSVLTSAATWFHGIDKESATFSDLLVGDPQSPGEVTINSQLRLREAGAVQLPSLWPVLHTDLFSDGFAGALNPFQLATAGQSVAVDLMRGKLIIGDVDADLYKGLDLAQAGVRQCSKDNDQRFLIKAQIGTEQGWMLVDTGTSSSMIYVRGAFDALTTGLTENAGNNPVSGVFETFRSFDIGEHRLRVGDWSMTLPLAAIEKEPACHEDGILGMDVLKHCTILWTSLGQNVICAPSTAPTRHFSAPKRPAPHGFSLIGFTYGETCDASSQPKISANFPVRFKTLVHGFAEMRSAVRSVGLRLASQCADKGFLKAKVNARLDRTPEGVTIHVGVVRGVKHRLRSFRITEIYPGTERELPADEVGLLVSSFKTDKLEFLSKFRNQASLVAHHYQRWAHPFVQANEIVLLDEAGNVDVEVRVCLAFADEIDDQFRKRCTNSASPSHWQTHTLGTQAPTPWSPPPEKSDIASQRGCLYVTQAELRLERRIRPAAAEKEATKAILEAHLAKRLAHRYEIQISRSEMAEALQQYARTQNISLSQYRSHLQTLGLSAEEHKAELRRQQRYSRVDWHMRSLREEQIAAQSARAGHSRVETIGSRCYELPPRP